MGCLSPIELRHIRAATNTLLRRSIVQRVIDESGLAACFSASSFYLLLFFLPSIFSFPSHVSARCCSHSVFRCSGFVPHFCDCLCVCVCSVCLCVCTSIKPTSILRGSRGRRAPTRPLGEGTLTLHLL